MSSNLGFALSHHFPSENPPKRSQENLEVLRNDSMSLMKPQADTCGYTISEIRLLLGSVPTDVSEHLKQLFILVQERSLQRISWMKAVHALYVNKSNTREDDQDRPRGSHLDVLSDLNSDMGSHALLRVSYDPCTHRITRLDLNQRMADLLGVPLDTARIILAADGLAVPMPAWDCICAFVDTMLHLSASVVLRFFRFCSAHRRPCKAALVSGTVSKTFNAVGEVVQVPITPLPG